MCMAPMFSRYVFVCARVCVCVCVCTHLSLFLSLSLSLSLSAFIMWMIVPDPARHGWRQMFPVSRKNNHRFSQQNAFVTEWKMEANRSGSNSHNSFAIIKTFL